MANVKGSILGTDKVLSMEQVVGGKGGAKGASVIGPTILGTDKVLSMEQVVGGGTKNQ